MFTENWKDLTPEQRLQTRLDAWQNIPVPFASPEVKQTYTDRVQLWRDAIALKKPAHVPIAPWIALFPMRYAGYTGRDGYYDYEKLGLAWDKYHEDFQPDALAFTLTMVPGKLFDILDYKLYDWPGHGTDEDTSYQYNEKEWMKDDEYDALIADPSGYWQRIYLPRAFGALEPWSMLPPFTDLVEIPFTAPFFAAFAAPPVKEMLRKIMDAGDAAMEWLQAFMAIDGKLMATLGIPQMAGSATKAPYDIIGDTMRGTRGLMLDKFRRPEKLKAAMDRLVPLAIDWAVRSNDVTGNPLVFIPIHKGADGFMSDADYREFYWPTLQGRAAGPHQRGPRAPGVRRGRLQRAPGGDRRPGHPQGPHDLDVRRHRHGAREADRGRAPVHRRQRARLAVRHGHARADGHLRARPAAGHGQGRRLPAQHRHRARRRRARPTSRPSSTPAASTAPTSEQAKGGAGGRCAPARPRPRAWTCARQRPP